MYVLDNHTCHLFREALLDDLIYRMSQVVDYHITPIFMPCTSLIIICYFSIFVVSISPIMIHESMDLAHFTFTIASLVLRRVSGIL